MKLFYHLILLYLTLNFVWYLFRERKFWSQAGTVLVLILFILRLFLIK